jgi:hypothetical protein
MTWRVAAIALLAPVALEGQIAPRTAVSYEARVDARMARQHAVEAGASVIFPSSMYVHLALTVVEGGVWRGDLRAESRYEATARFLLDPFREAPYGLSLGAGVGITDSDGSWRPFLAVLSDLELRRRPGWTPAVQLGLGGGWRVGIALRNSRGTWR